MFLSNRSALLKTAGKSAIIFWRFNTSLERREKKAHLFSRTNHVRDHANVINDTYNIINPKKK